MTVWDVVNGVEVVARVGAASVVGAAGVVALTHWAVRKGHVEPFGQIPTTVRRYSDPVLKPLEKRLVVAGRNPQDAVWWLFGISLVGGLLVLSALRWILGSFLAIAALPNAGPRLWVQTAVGGLFDLVIIAILIRVVGSWVGLNHYAKWMRPVRFLTDWIMDPIRRWLPPFGALDLSPLVAYLAVIFLRSILLRIL